MIKFLKILFFPIFVYFKRKDQKIKEKVKEVTESYEELISEYKLIKEKKSTLSSTQRAIVEARIIFLIGEGHIKVN